jgi:hypothetical protein
MTDEWWFNLPARGVGPTELSDPVQFEPVGQVTAVFFDVKNQQVRTYHHPVML